MTEDEYYLHSLGEEFKEQVSKLIEKSLVLCTAHVKPDTLEAFDKNETPLRSAPHQYGSIVFVQLGKNDDERELDDNWFLEKDMGEFLLIYRAAVESQCSIINFDNGAEESEAFETFSDW